MAIDGCVVCDGTSDVERTSKMIRCKREENMQKKGERGNGFAMEEETVQKTDE